MDNNSSKNQNYFDFISIDLIASKLSYLKEALPAKPTKKNYQITNKMLFIEGIITERNLQEKLQQVADKMRDHLLIEKYIKILTIPTVEAGKFERIDDLNCIYINNSLDLQSYKQKVAILAHEMSHFYLIYQHNIYFADKNENELLTEINAIFIGFGFLLLEGYETFKSTRKNKQFMTKVGYIDIRTCKRTIVQTAYIRKQNPTWILKNIHFRDIPYFGFQLLNLIIAYSKAKKAQR